MKKPGKPKPVRRATNGLRPEYRFEFARSKPNRFADRFGKGSVLVVLEPDVASVFKDSASVNKLLRSVARAVRPGKRVVRPPSRAKATSR